MLDIDKFTAQKETAEIGDQTLEITALTFNELKRFMKYAERNDNDGASDYILFTVLRKNVPTKEENSESGKTDDELWKFVKNSIDGKKAAEIIQKVQKISGIGEDDESSKKASVEEKKQVRRQPNPSAKE